MPVASVAQMQSASRRGGGRRACGGHGALLAVCLLASGAAGALAAQQPGKRPDAPPRPRSPRLSTGRRRRSRRPCGTHGVSPAGPKRSAGRAEAHCGELGAVRARPHQARRASMRPQHITAENFVPSADWNVRSSCFNEAAAYNCGERLRQQLQGVNSDGFNEAAAYNCGEPPGPGCSSSPGPARFNEAAEYNCGEPRAGLTAVAAARSFNEAAAYNCGERGGRRRRRWRGRRFNEAAAYNCGGN